MTPYTPPGLNESAFHCPLCGAYADHVWADMAGIKDLARMVFNDFEGRIARCAHCEGYTIWYYNDMIYPDASLAPMPNSDLPDEIRADFEEAMTIVQRSPRGAAALLRLCVQKLCVHLGERGKKIDDDIAALVKKGLSPMIQQSLDLVRVIGNNAVHPGTIDFKDKPETAVQLAKLINLIADAMITQPKAVEELYNGLPEAARKAIEKRDAP